MVRVSDYYKVSGSIHGTSTILNVIMSGMEFTQTCEDN